MNKVDIKLRRYDVKNECIKVEVFNNVVSQMGSLRGSGGLQVGQFKGILDVLAYVSALGAFLKEGEEEKKLFVVSFSAHVGVDWDTVVEVEGETHDGVVYNNHIFAVTVTDDIEVFNVELVDLDAVLSVEALGEHLSVFIDVVHDVIGILLLACSEHNDLIVRS